MNKVKYYTFFCNYFLKDLKELRISKITIFLDSTTDILSTFPNHEGHYCFDVK